MGDVPFPASRALQTVPQEKLLGTLRGDWFVEVAGKKTAKLQQVIVHGRPIRWGKVHERLLW
jgi:hypothetical protein